MAFYHDQVSLEKQQLAALLGLLETHYQPAHLLEELSNLKTQNQQSHHTTEQGLFVQGLHDGADEQETSTLLNVNRELRAEVDNFARAIGFLRLADDGLVD